MPTKSDYTTRINTLRPIASTRSPAVSATDIARAAAKGVTLAKPFTGLEGNATVGDLPSTKIKGSEIKDIAVEKMTHWSDVRRIKYVLTGAGSSYQKYANVTSPDPSYGGPTQSSPTFDDLNLGQPISLDNFDDIITALSSVLTNQTNILQHTINYCHSSCHSSCHVSRGRR